MKLRTTLRTSLIALAMALSIPFVEAQTSNQHAINMYNLGLNAYKNGSTEAAIIFFRRACDIDPNLADAQYNLGKLYQSQRRVKEAVPRFQEVLRVKPNDPDAHYELAIGLIELNRAAEARPHLASIPPSNPQFQDAQRRMQQIDSGAPAVGASSQPVNQLPPPRETYAAAAQPETIGRQVEQPPPVTTFQPATETSRYMPAQPVAAAPPSAPPSYTASEAPAYPTRSVTQAPAPNATPVAVLANSSVRIIATGFSGLAGLCFDRGGNLYVANFLSNTIDRISPDGSRSQFSAGANLKGPIGMTVDDSNNVYVANFVGGSILRINPAGVSTIIATGFKNPYYLTLDRDGNLFVTQQGDNSIVRISLPRTAAASASR